MHKKNNAKVLWGSKVRDEIKVDKENLMWDFKVCTAQWIRLHGYSTPFQTWDIILVSLASFLLFVEKNGQNCNLMWFLYAFMFWRVKCWDCKCLWRPVGQQDTIWVIFKSKILMALKKCAVSGFKVATFA